MFEKKVGLENIVNTCYMNSVLQCLNNVNELTLYFLENKIISKNENTLLAEYINVLRELSNKSNKKGYFAPRNFKKVFQNKNSMFRNNEQDDSAEFLANLLYLLNNDCKIYDKYEIPDFEIRDEELKEEIMDYYDENNTIISKFFINFIEIKEIYKESKYNNIDYEPNYFISLPVQKGGKPILTLKDSFNEFNRKKQFLNDDNTQSFHETLKIVTVADILIINLKRVVKNKHFSHFLDYPNRFNVLEYGCINPTNKSSFFSLIGIVKHIGNQYGGHKVAYCKDKNNWYIFDDKKAEPINVSDSYPREILAFLLFYQRELDESEGNPSIDNDNLTKFRNWQRIEEEKRNKENEILEQFLQKIYYKLDGYSHLELLNKFNDNDITNDGLINKDTFEFKIKINSNCQYPPQFLTNEKKVRIFNLAEEYQKYIQNKDYNIQDQTVIECQKKLYNFLKKKSDKNKATDYFNSLLKTFNSQEIFNLIKKSGFNEDDIILKKVLNMIIPSPIKIKDFITKIKEVK